MKHLILAQICSNGVTVLEKFTLISGNITAKHTSAISPSSSSRKNKVFRLSAQRGKKLLRRSLKRRNLTKTKRLMKAVMKVRGMMLTKQMKSQRASLKNHTKMRKMLMTRA